MERKNNTQPLNNRDISKEKPLLDIRSTAEPDGTSLMNQTSEEIDPYQEKTVELVHPEGQTPIDNHPDENTVLRIGTVGAAVSDPNAQTEALPDPSPVKLDFMSGPRVISRHRSKPLPLYLTIPLVTLSSLLILSAFGLILFASTFQYKGALATQALANTQATRSIQTTANAQDQATVNALGTVQAQILATATSQAAAQASATAALDQATAVASQKLDQFSKASTGTPTLDDPLSDNTGKGKWDSGTASPGTGCNFVNGSYNVTVGQRGFLQPCLARATSYTNMAYQVQMTIVGGSQGGLLFDANPTANTYYLFRIGTDSSYALDLYNGSSHAQTLSSGINAAITPGLNASNTLSVQTNNGEIDLFANQTYIATVTDTQLSSGEVGVAAIDYNTPTQINFTSAQAWGKLG